MRPAIAKRLCSPVLQQTKRPVGAVWQNSCFFQSVKDNFLPPTGRCLYFKAKIVDIKAIHLVLFGLSLTRFGTFSIF